MKTILWSTGKPLHQKGGVSIKEIIRLERTSFCRKENPYVAKGTLTS